MNMDRQLNIQWFPGHMNKTRRLLSENLKLVDVVIELIDSRIPISSKNPEIDNIIKDKKRVIAMNKSDLADDVISKMWEKWYAAQGITCVLIDSLSGKGIKQLQNKMKEAIKEKLEKDRKRGRIFRPIRTMVVGIPNVGKSSFINKIAGKRSAATGDRPGVTRGPQWVRLNREIQLLDTPGILWPKFEDSRVGLNLAFTGAIKDDIIDIVSIASSLMETLALLYPQNIIRHYKLTSVEGIRGEELLHIAGKNRGCIAAGGEVDYNRIAAIVLDEFRGGKIGRITLEKPMKTEN